MLRPHVPSRDPLDHFPFFYWHPPVKVTPLLPDLDAMLLLGRESGFEPESTGRNPPHFPACGVHQGVVSPCDCPSKAPNAVSSKVFVEA